MNNFFEEFKKTMSSALSAIRAEIAGSLPGSTAVPRHWPFGPGATGKKIYKKISISPSLTLVGWDKYPFRPIV